MKLLSGLFLAFLFVVGCQPTDENRENLADENGADNTPHRMEAGEEMMSNKAIAVLQPTEGNDDVKGTVKFTRDGNVVHVVAEVSGLKPGKHGFHIHEFGDCSAADASSAGGHFAPHQNQHGAPVDQNRHVGDLGNIEADASGNATLEWSDSLMSFTGMNSIIGHAVVVHAGEDDLTSQPSGDAGGRVACGVIGIAKE